MGRSIKVKAAVITTVDHNIGDDFVREGLLYLLEQAGLLENAELIHKHSPITSFPGGRLFRGIRVAPMIDRLLRKTPLRDKIDKADVVIQSGAPIYWCHEGGPHCADNEWFDPLIRGRFIPGVDHKPFLNLAGGSCQRYHSDGLEFAQCQKCLDYIKFLFDVSTVTILRDPIARVALNQAGRDAPVLPCASLFARDRFNIGRGQSEYVVVNFMENGAHYTFGQEIDGEKWRMQFKNLTEVLASSERVVVACHTNDEYQLAKELVPDVERFLIPNDHRAFLEFYSKSKWGVLNRVHGAFAMASFGVPAAVIGNDTRARMVNEIGLDSYYVGDIEHVGIETIIDSARSRCGDYEDYMVELKQRTRSEYLKVIGSTL